MEPLACPICGAMPEETAGGEPWGLPAVLNCPTREWQRGVAEISHSLMVIAPTHAEAIAAWNALVSPHPKEGFFREPREVREALREDRDAKGSGGAP